MKTPVLPTAVTQPITAAATPPQLTNQPAPTASTLLAAPVAAPPVVEAPAAPSPPQPASAPVTVAAPSHNPVTQLTPALVTFAAPASGTQHLTVRLAPPELGSVTIRVERAPEAPPRVEITVQHPQTLSLMLRDEPQLHHALDQAGVAAEGRSLTFHLSDPGGGGSPGSGGAEDHRPAATDRPTPPTAAIDEGPEPAVPIAPTWRRAGLDITA